MRSEEEYSSRSFCGGSSQRGAAASDPFVELLSRYNCRSTSAIGARFTCPPMHQGRWKPSDGLRAMPATWEHPFAGMSSVCDASGMPFGMRISLCALTAIFRNTRTLPISHSANLARDYIAAASSACEKVQRLRVVRVVAGALQRAGIAAVKPVGDRLVRQEMARTRRRPYIFTKAEIQKLLRIAGNLNHPSTP